MYLMAQEDSSTKKSDSSGIYADAKTKELEFPNHTWYLIHKNSHHLVFANHSPHQTMKMYRFAL